MPKFWIAFELHRPSEAVDGPNAGRPAPKFFELLRNFEYKVKFLHSLWHDWRLPTFGIPKKRCSRNRELKAKNLYQLHERIRFRVEHGARKLVALQANPRALRPANSEIFDPHLASFQPYPRKRNDPRKFRPFQGHLPKIKRNGWHRCQLYHGQFRALESRKFHQKLGVWRQ